LRGCGGDSSKNQQKNTDCRKFGHITFKKVKSDSSDKKRNEAKYNISAFKIRSLKRRRSDDLICADIGPSCADKALKIRIPVAANSRCQNVYHTRGRNQKN
jgi:hypothetical protein